MRGHGEMLAVPFGMQCVFPAPQAVAAGDSPTRRGKQLPKMSKTTYFQLGERSQPHGGRGGLGASRWAPQREVGTRGDISVGFLQLIQKDLEEEEERSPSQGSLRFRHKQPVELKGPDGIHVVHGSTGTLLASDLNSLPEDDQKVLGRSLETLTADCGGYGDHNARTESAKSTPLHKMREVIMESPLEITEL